MRRTKSKSTSKVFQGGTDLSDLMMFAMDNIETEGGHKPIEFGPWKVDTPISVTKHKYSITITKIIEKCEACGAQFDGSYSGPVCPRCDEELLEKLTFTPPPTHGF
jgi:hypothetical protein